MSTDRDDKAPKLFTEAPWNGSRTPAFRKFKRDIQAGADAYFLHEDENSILQAWLDTDTGGQDPAADPLPAVGVNGHINAVRRRRRRQAKAFSILYNHIDDVRLREMLSAIPRGDRRGVEAWNLLIEECDEGTTDLQILAIRAEFETASIEKDVGYNEETVTFFARLLNSINSRLPLVHAYSEEQLSVKFLCNINHPDSLALEAVTELNAVARFVSKIRATR